MFDNGDWVRITREGISHDSLGAVVGKELYKGKAIYRVILLDMPDIEITCQEEDLERWTDHIKKKNLPSICECGGDQLEIPHHYDWCPKG
tara:strand:+ start:113 stop:382 length:270 start_codon:yes stop_codon:yes gene_type:complete